MKTVESQGFSPVWSRDSHRRLNHNFIVDRDWRVQTPLIAQLVGLNLKSGLSTSCDYEPRRLVLVREFKTLISHFSALVEHSVV